MKILTGVVLAGMVLVAGNPAFAGRDESQMMQLQLAMKAMQAKEQAQAKQERAGLAGATGIPGKVGPSAQPSLPKRDPTAHP